MNRQKKLAVLVGVLVALCAIIAIVSGVQKHIDTISTIDEEIYATSESALTAVSWTKEGTTLSFTQTEDTWHDAEDEDFPVDQDKMSDFLAHFENVHASFIIEDVEDFAQYGLDAPSCTITLTSEEGDTVIQLGDYSTMDEKRYLTLGDGTVYLIDDDLAEYAVTDRDELMRQDNVPEYETLDTIVATGESAFTVEYHPDEELTYTEDIADAGYDTLRPDEILSLNWDDVQSIDFTIGEDSYTAEKDGDTWTINGEEVEFEDVTDAIDGLKVNEFNTEFPAKKQEAAFTVHLDNDSFPTLTVTLYQYDGENCLAQLDGTTLGFVSRSLVVDLTEAVNAITLGLE